MFNLPKGLEYLSAVDVLDGLLPEEEEDIVAFGHGSNEVGGWLKKLKDVLWNRHL